MWLTWWRSDVKWLTGSDNKKKKLLSVKYMIYVHHLGSYYALSVRVTVQQLPKALVACFYKSKQVAHKASLHMRRWTRAGDSSQQRAPLPVLKMAASRGKSPSSQCPWRKRRDVFDTGANTKPPQPLQEPRCCANKKIKNKKFNISLSIIWRHQEPAAGEKRLISSVTSEKKKKGNEIMALKQDFRLPRRPHGKILLDMKMCDCGSGLNLTHWLSTEKERS